MKRAGATEIAGSLPLSPKMIAATSCMPSQSCAHLPCGQLYAEAIWGR